MVNKFTRSQKHLINNFVQTTFKMGNNKGDFELGEIVYDIQPLTSHANVSINLYGEEHIIKTSITLIEGDVFCDKTARYILREKLVACIINKLLVMFNNAWAKFINFYFNVNNRYLDAQKLFNLSK